VRLEQFEQFIALGRLRHFRQAAEYCNLSTSALTRSIQTLEQDLNCQLVSRSTRSVALTEAGEIFLQYCQQCLDAHQLLVQKLARFNGAKLDKITIGYSADATRIVPQACGKFMQQYPNISIEMQLQEQGNLQQKIQGGLIDLAISADLEQHQDTTVQTLPEQVLLVAHKDHPLANLSFLPKTTMSSYPLLGCMSNSPTVVKLIEQVADSFDKRSSMRLGNFEQISKLLEDRHQLALVGLEYLSEVRNLPELKVLDVSYESANVNLALHVAKAALDQPSINHLLSFIQMEANEQSNVNLNQLAV
jgi:DNA-binding transcriptional LysR family regulator